MRVDCLVKLQVGSWSGRKVEKVGSLSELVDHALLVLLLGVILDSCSICCCMSPWNLQAMVGPKAGQMSSQRVSTQSHHVWFGCIVHFCTDLVHTTQEVPSF